ncbi:MAG: hypothetical protein ACRD1M_14145 [Terriglobales bacterium]
MKRPQPPAPRVGAFNRFQTAVGGLGYVPTAMDAHFDPYADPVKPPARPLASLERVPTIVVDGGQ